MLSCVKSLSDVDCDMWKLCRRGWGTEMGNTVVESMGWGDGVVVLPNGDRYDDTGGACILRPLQQTRLVTMYLNDMT